MTVSDRRLNLIVVVTAVVTFCTLGVASWSLPNVLSGARNAQALRDIQEANDCRSRIAAENQVASDRVLLIIARGLSDPSTTAQARAELGPAVADLEKALVRRDRITELCSP